MSYSITRSSLHRDLERITTGEVLTDPVSREVYATAACLYRVPPLAVVRPRLPEEAAAIVAFAALRGIPVTARGAGTAVAGQSLGSGIIIDFISHFDRVLSIDADSREAVVQPGVVLGNLNRRLAEIGLRFPPDPSSGDYATIGGMVANNSSGARSLKYGDTRAWTARLKTILADGSVIWMEKKPMMPPAMAGSPNLENRIYAGLPELLDKNAELIERSRPMVKKNSSGYHVWDLMSGRDLDPVPLLVGSEGTLALTIKAHIGLDPLPGGRAVALVGFDSIEAAAEVVKGLLEFKPSALEIMDNLFVDMVRAHREDLAGLLPASAGALLLIEFEEKSGPEAREMMEKARAACGARARTFMQAASEHEAELIWAIRKAASPILYRMPGRRLTRFVEDVVVPVKKLAEGIEAIKNVLHTHGTDAPILGHAGSGNLHVNPRLNLEQAGEREKMREIADEIYSLVIEMGGSITGEHGDGMLRAGYVPLMYPELTPVFRRIKEIFDTDGILNPGKILAGHQGVPVDNLRFGEETDRSTKYPALLAGPGLEMLMRCHGCGLCRTYCPVFAVRRDEHSLPRSKVGLLRALALGDLEADSPDTEIMLETAMDLCTACQRCVIGCPTGIEPALLIRAFMEDYYRSKGRPLRERLFARADRLLEAGARSPGAVSAILDNRPARKIMEIAVGLRADSPLILPSPQSPRAGQAEEKGEAHAELVLYPGCLGRWADREGEVEAAIAILQGAGRSVIVPDLPCCGEPALAAADMEAARKRARELSAKLEKYASTGLPVVSACQTCVFNLRTEYPRLLGEDAASIASLARDFFEYLDSIKKAEIPATGPVDMETAIYHRSCRHHALGAVDYVSKALERIPGLRLVRVEDVCCGLAGLYGLRAKNAAVSDALAKTLFEAAERAGTRLVVSACPSCRAQIRALGLEPVSAIALLKKSMAHAPDRK